MNILYDKTKSYFNSQLFYNFITYNYYDFIQNINESLITINDSYNLYFQQHYNNHYKFKASLYTYTNYQLFLNEALVSHNPEKFINKIKEYLDCIISVSVSNDAITLITKGNEYENNLFTLCRVYGYYIVLIEHNVSNEIFEYTIEPTFGYTNATGNVYNKYNGILYHITSKRKSNKILKYGLIPKHLDKKVSHPGRIYFSTTSDIDELTFLGQQLYSNNDYVILKVNLNKMHQVKLNFYIDPAYAEYGVFTCENIATYCISVLEI